MVFGPGKKNLFVWINPVRIMYRVFPFEQTAQWWSFVWSCLTLKFPWQERKHNSDIFVCFRNFVQRKVGWNLIEVMFFRRRWELFFPGASRCSFIFDYFRVCFINCQCHLRGWGVDEDPVHLFPFYFNVCFMNCRYRLKRGVDEGPLLTPFPPQLLRENGCLPKTDCSRYIL